MRTSSQLSRSEHVPIQICMCGLLTHTRLRCHDWLYLYLDIGLVLSASLSVVGAGGGGLAHHWRVSGPARMRFNCLRRK